MDEFLNGGGDSDFVPGSTSESESMEEAVSDNDSPITQDEMSDSEDIETLSKVYEAAFDHLVDAFRAASRALHITLDFDDLEDLAQRGVQDLHTAFVAKAAELAEEEDFDPPAEVSGPMDAFVNQQ